MSGVPMVVLIWPWFLFQLVGASVTQLLLLQTPVGAQATPHRKLLGAVFPTFLI